MTYMTRDALHIFNQRLFLKVRIHAPKKTLNYSIRRLHLPSTKYPVLRNSNNHDIERAASNLLLLIKHNNPRSSSPPSLPAFPNPFT